MIQQATQQAQQQDQPGLLRMTTRTEQVVIIMFSATVCLILAGIAAVLCARVAIDGNAPLTIQITQELAGAFPWLLGALVVAIVGRSALAKITGG